MVPSLRLTGMWDGIVVVYVKKSTMGRCGDAVSSGRNGREGRGGGRQSVRRPLLRPNPHAMLPSQRQRALRVLVAAQEGGESSALPVLLLRDVEAGLSQSSFLQI